MPETLIRCEGLTKQYKTLTALNELSLTIPAGGVCGLLGVNGAGKTTTIKMLMGLTPPTRGRAEVLGFDPATQPIEVKQRLGYVPETHHIYSWMTGAQVLRFTSGVYRHWDQAESDRVTRLLKVPLGRKVKEMSRGELAKLALTIALSHNPRLLILDEPTSGLDPMIRQEFLEAIRSLIVTGERTVIFSTHILSDAEAVADRILVLDGGRLRADGTPAQIRARCTKAAFTFDAPPPESAKVAGAIRVDRAASEWTVLLPPTAPAELDDLVRSVGATGCRTLPVTLDDAFFSIVKTNGEASR